MHWNESHACLSNRLALCRVMQRYRSDTTKSSSKELTTGGAARTGEGEEGVMLRLEARLPRLRLHSSVKSVIVNEGGVEAEERLRNPQRIELQLRFLAYYTRGNVFCRLGFLRLFGYTPFVGLVGSSSS